MRAHLRRGVTLIEILVVVGIIAILATLAMWSAGKLTDDAKARHTRQILGILNNAISAYHDAKGYYPGWSLQPSVGYYYIPFDPNEVMGSGGTLRTPFRSIPPVNPSDCKPSSSEKVGIERVDFFQLPNDCVGGSAKAEPTTEKGYTSYPVNPVYSVANANDRKGDKRKIYSIQALVYRLRCEPTTKAIIDRLPDESIVTTEAARRGKALVGDSLSFFQDSGDLIIIVDGESPVLEVQTILDAWNRPLYYGWDQSINNGVPFVQSAGPDGLWSTEVWARVYPGPRSVKSLYAVLDDQKTRDDIYSFEMPK